MRNWPGFGVQIVQRVPPPSSSPARRGGGKGWGRDVIRITAKRFERLELFERLEQSYLRSLTCAQKRSTFTTKATSSAAFCISRTPIKATLFLESSKGPAFSVLKIRSLTLVCWRV